MKPDSIINISKEVTKFSPEVYKDALKPSFQNVGKALGTVTNLVNTFLTPFELFNESISIKKEKWLKDYEEKVNAIPSDKHCDPNFEIIAPMVDHLKFKITEDTLAEKYAQLLSAASHYDGLTKPLLSFDNVLNQLSPYEVELITQIFANSIEQIYALGSIKEISDTGHRYLCKDIPIIPFKDLQIETITVMISNFERLGLVKIDFSQSMHPDDSYNYITNSPQFLKMKHLYQEERKKTMLSYPDCILEKGVFYLTEFGKSFTETVIR